MKQWKFKVFIKLNGHDAFEDWITGLDADSEEKIRARLDMMSITPWMFRTGTTGSYLVNRSKQKRQDVDSPQR
jgi:hypothetical protein